MVSEEPIISSVDASSQHKRGILCRRQGFGLLLENYVLEREKRIIDGFVRDACLNGELPRGRGLRSEGRFEIVERGTFGRVVVDCDLAGLLRVANVAGCKSVNRANRTHRGHSVHDGDEPLVKAKRGQGSRIRSSSARDGQGATFDRRTDPELAAEIASSKSAEVGFRALFNLSFAHVPTAARARKPHFSSFNSRGRPHTTLKLIGLRVHSLDLFGLFGGQASPACTVENFTERLEDALFLVSHFIEIHSLKTPLSLICMRAQTREPPSDRA